MTVHYIGTANGRPACDGYRRVVLMTLHDYAHTLNRADVTCPDCIELMEAPVICRDCGMEHTTEHSCEPIDWTYGQTE